jgi:hypothetical protein
MTGYPFVRTEVRGTDIGGGLDRSPVCLRARGTALLKVVPELIRGLELVTPSLLVGTHLKRIGDAGTRVPHILQTMGQ